MATKVFVGMSGGVDSSVTAALLLKQGYEVEGINLVLVPGDPGLATKDAQAVCDVLNIPLHVIDLRDDFKKYVIDNFVDEYKNGRTPNPCVVCNENIKFGKLLDIALEMGGDYIATGHYAKIEEEDGKFYLKRADSRKDQSYFLNRLNQHQLSHTMFPMFDLEKMDTRKIAEELGLPVAHKSDSQEICFVTDDDYVGFIKDYSGYESQPGRFIDMDGNNLGEHKGIINYTIGQRKGLGIAFGEPMFVTKINADTNEITLAPAGFQHIKEFVVENVSYVYLDAPLNEEIRVDVKIRCQAKPEPATIVPISESSVRVVFDVPQRAVTPGQSAVFYIGDSVLGGGFIS